MSQRLSEGPTQIFYVAVERLEKLSDIAMDTENYNYAAQLFSAILSLDPTDRVDILLKRCTARVLTKSRDEALSDANEVCVCSVP